jgi:hypothetical protein
MASRRFTIVVSDQTSGVERRVTVSWRPAVMTVCAVMTLPVLGMVTQTMLGGFLHILLVIAIAVVLIRVIQGRRPL